MTEPLSRLALGWRVDGMGHPKYWLRQDARPGGHSEDDLVQVRADKMAKHTAIIAQSGSGKSFFLGRLVEEILLKTRSRVVIIDPNADFRKIHRLQPPARWEKASYNPEKYIGMLHTESSASEVEPRWTSMTKVVFHGGSLGDREGFEQLKLWWPYLSTDILSQGLSPTERIQLRHAHEFVKAVANLQKMWVDSASEKRRAPWLLSESERYLLEIQQKRSQGEDARTACRMVFQRLHEEIREGWGSSFDEARRQRVEGEIERAGLAAHYVSPEVAAFYFARAQEFKAEGMLRSEPTPDVSHIRAAVVDLPSMPNREVRLSAMYQLLTRLLAMRREEWEQAIDLPSEEDRRVPMFIVVDEAHNLLPGEPRDQATAAVREMFRTIAAEGRKFGLFLVAVSQRPDKLDPLVLSECENKIVMHVDSETIIDKLRGVLGFSEEESEMLRDCTSYRLGRGLLLGAWASGQPVKFMSAARRTQEGGRNLRKEWWARPGD